MIHKTVYNMTRDIGLCKKVRQSKTYGLMFRAPLKEDEAILFTFSKPCKVWVHMLCVFFPLDMVFTDAKGKVVHLIESARPFKLKIAPPMLVSSLLELKAGAIRRTNTQLGDSIVGVKTTQ